MMQISKVDRQQKNIAEAQNMLNNIEGNRKIFFEKSKEIEQDFHDRKAKMLMIKEFYDEQLKESERILKENDSTGLKNKLKEQEFNFKDLENEIQESERRLEEMRTKHEQEDPTPEEKLTF